ncbi:MAG: sugar phosphate isomerase/epimerase [Paenibacillaceae bacterium]|nr:sugar phosphate isomerase/epimerase [Paenibacillaceae bacterium]
MTLPLIMHINYCEQGQSLDEACRKAVDWGFDGIEFRCRNMRQEESSEQYLDRIEQAVRQSGLKQVVFGGPGISLMNPDAGARATEVEWLCDFYRLAADRFPLTVCNAIGGILRNPVGSIPLNQYALHGSFAAGPEHWSWAAEGFRAIAETVSSRGFRIAFETHMLYLHDMPAATLKLIEAIGSPAVGVNLDYGNLVYFEPHDSLEDTIDLVRDRLYYVHLKNSIAFPGGTRFPTALAEGEINHRHFLQRLKAVGYAGPICIEAPRPGDREWYAQQDVAYIRAVMRDVGI